MAPAQPTFSDPEASLGRVEPHYPKAGGGRPPVPLGTMLRMYVEQVAFQLSDEGTEDALWDSAAVRSFVGCGDAVPDATTPCRFRSLLAANGPGGALLDEPDASLEAEGLRMSAGTIVDATFVEAPPSTKNARKQRDPEAHQAKKGQDRHFGFKAHVGVDAVTGTVHTLEVTAASAHDLTRAASPVGPGDADVWADSGYTGVSKWVEGTPAASARWRVARRKGSTPEAERASESLLASVRSRVEHAFRALKDLVGLRRTRYRGLSKVTNQPCAAFAVANCLLASRRPPLQGPPACAKDRVRLRSELVGVLRAAAAAA